MGHVVLTALLVIGIMGLIIGLFLGGASILFKVEVDEREEKILNALPGNNCGGCGYPGCEGLAKAICKGEAPVDQCPVGGSKVHAEIAKIMGTEAGEKERLVAFVACKAHCGEAVMNYEYTGVEDCRMLGFVPGGGPKACTDGCLGFGTCASVCPFDAIHVVDGVAVVDRDKCKACGKCVAICPKHLISLVPATSKYTVSCSSHAKGAVTTKQCKSGCVGCGICEKNCPNGAVKVENFNASIDYSKCLNCGVCAEKCPKKCIVNQYTCETEASE